MRPARIVGGVGVGATHGMHGMHGALLGWVCGMIFGSMVASGAASAAEPATIPTADAAAAPRCTVGQPCTFAASIFACDYASAERMAQAGSLNGRATGPGYVPDATCQTVAAGRLVATEATKSAQVVYLTEGGKHLGYMPVGVFGSSGTGAQTPCGQPGFCAVRRGGPIWICPRAENLTLSTSEAKSGAKCLRISDSNASEVTSLAEDTVTLANMFGGRPPYQPSYYAARADFVELSLKPYPTPAARGWCRPDTWCVTAAPTMFCGDRAAYERVQAMPPGEPRRLAIQSEPGCRILVPGNLLKPKEPEPASDPMKLVSVEHPTLSSGWASADAFPIIAFSPPLRDTARLADLTISASRSPNYSATDIRGQGTSTSSGVFRSGPQERREFCNGYWEKDQIEPLNSCLSEPDATITVKANCEARETSLNGRRYGLFERPHDAAPDIHLDEHRQMLYRDLTTREWLDGSTVSGEVTVRSALNAMCPGIDPEVPYGLIYRDPRAQYPRELWGRWFSDPRACADSRRNDSEYDEYIWILITERTESSRDSTDTLSAVRQAGRDAWVIDSTSPSQEETLNFFSMLYTMTRNGLETRLSDAKDGNRPTRWVRCSP